MQPHKCQSKKGKCALNAPIMLRKTNIYIVLNEGSQNGGHCGKVVNNF